MSLWTAQPREHRGLEVNKPGPVLQQGLGTCTPSNQTYSWLANAPILLCPCWPLNSVFFLPKCSFLMYFWRRATGSLSTHSAQLNVPLSSSLLPLEHFVKIWNRPSPFLSTWSKGNIFLTRTQDLCFHITSYHFFIAPILFCSYWKYLSQCSLKMHLLFSWLRKNPLSWFTIILRLNTAPQPLPPPFQHSALSIVFIRMHI